MKFKKLFNRNSDVKKSVDKSASRILLYDNLNPKEAEVIMAYVDDRESSIRNDLQNMEERLNNKIEKLDTKFDTRIDQLELKLESKLESKIDKQTIRLGGMIFLGVSVLGILGFFH